MTWKTAPIWRTTLLAILLFAGLGSAFAVDGFDTEIRTETAEAEPLGTLTVPVPYIGDAGEYVSVTYNLSAGPEPGRNSTHPFRWLDPLRLPGHDGAVRDYDRLDLPDGFGGMDGLAGAWKGATVRIEFTDAAEHRVAGRLLEGESPDGFDGCGGGGCPETNTSYRRVVQHYGSTYFGRTPCGLLNPLQGATIDLEAGPVRILSPCAWFRDDVPLYNVSHRAGGGDHAFVVFEPVDGTGPDEVWMSPDFPYPVRYVWNYEWNGVEYRDEKVLGSFARGDRPLASFDSVPVIPLPLAPATFTGPDEEGVTHRFPLSMAWQTALDDPTGAAQAFLDDHPDAYMAYAWHGRSSDVRDGDVSTESTETDTWWTMLSDGKDGLQVNITRTLRDTTTNAYSAGSVPGTETHEVTDDVETNEVPTPERPASRQVPDSLPAVATLWTHWQQATTSGEAPNSWGFSVQCRDDCTEVHVRLGAGFTDDYFRREGGGGPGLQVYDWWPVGGPGVDSSGHSEDFYYVDVAADGSNPWAYFYQNVKAIHDADSPPPAAPKAVSSEATPVEATVRTYEVRVWNPPTPEVVAGAGAVALVLVILHHFFPGLFRLFTRVRTDQALEHPVRARLHAAIQAEPGIHVREISRRLELPRGTVEHHLRKLEQLDLVKARVQGRHRAYFLPDVARYQLEATSALRSAGARSILVALVGGKDLSVSDLARATGLAVATVHHHIGRLESVGLVQADRSPGVPAHIRITEAGRNASAAAS